MHQLNLNTLILISAISLLVLANPQFNLNASIIQSNRLWTRIKVGVDPLNATYQIIYDQHPRNWNQVLNYIYIPANQTAVNRKYPCKVRITTDNGAQQQKATIVFIVSDSRAYLSDIIFSYDQVFDDQFFNSGIFKGRAEMVKSLSASSLNLNTPLNTQYQKQLSALQKKMNSVSQIPGVGISEILQSMSQSDNKNIIIAGVKAALKFKQSLINNNYGAIVDALGKSQNGIQGIVNNISSLKTNIIDSAQRQLVLMSQIKGGVKPQPSQYRSIESIFSKLPGPQQLDAIITTADSLALVKTIQKVVQFELTCQQKVSYLSDLFGRMQSAITMKAFAAVQLKVIVEGATLQIERLSKQMAKNQQLIDKLEYKQIKDKLSRELEQLQSLYNKYNAQQLKVVPKKATIDVLISNIQAIRQISENNRQQLPIQKLQLNQVKYNIEKIQAQLRDAISNRNLHEANINKLQQSISKYDQDIKQDQQSLGQLQALLQTSQNQADDLKSKYKTLQVKIQSKRQEITNKQKRVAEIKSSISKLQQRMSFESKKMNMNQLQKLRAFVQNLQSVLPNVTEQVDQTNYRCNQVSQIQAVNSQNLVSYIIEPRQFASYIETSYNIKYNLANIQSDTISLTPISILDKQWEAKYGFPYNQNSYVKTSQFSYYEDFHCLSPSSIISSSGFIRDIGRNYIDIEQSGQFKRLILGSCSRLQSTSGIPQAGQVIFFKADKTQEGQYNLYKGSCV